MKASQKKQKGKKLESWITDQIIKYGLDDKAKRDGASGAGNREKRDVDTSMMVNGKTAGIEAKNHKNIHIPEWWKQAEKLDVLGYEPLLAFKINRDPYENTLVTLRLDTLLQLIKNQKDIDEDDNSGIPSADKWKIAKAIEALKPITKLLEKYNQ